jgi:quinol-cytochrome oxidoreductase complex cytochrome b subunit
MNAPLATQLHSSIPLIGPLLQGAAFGSLLAAAVLARAWRRRMQIKPWLVTAAWSLLGAGVALAVIIALALAAVGAHRSMPNDPVDCVRSESRPAATSARSRVSSSRSAGSRTWGGSAWR